ncbi:Deoxyribonuclease-2-alpha, partial [Trichinella sp. T9]
LYKAPAQNTGKALIAGAVQNWQAYPQVTGLINHSFGKAVQHVVAVDANNKFIAYSNVPPDIPKVKTKSNSKGVLMMNPGVADEASWIVHTIPGFPKALRGYVFPPAEIQKGHLLICLTIKESQIDPIAKTLRIATPLIYHSDIPDTQMNSRPNLKKLVDGESRFVPPLTVSQEISTESAQGLKVTIYSKGEKSRYEMYKRILVKQLKSTIKVWTTRDNILKSDCRKVGRNIKLITSPISVNGDASTLENDVSQWLVSEAGNKFCAIDKPYQKSQAKEPAMAVCIDDVTVFTLSDAENFASASSVPFHRFIAFSNIKMTIVYKAPGQPNGKIIFATAAVSWNDGAQALSSDNGHSFATALQHVVRDNGNIKFLAYNNAPPGVANVKTKSNSKGVIILATNADSAAWIVHTVPGFPAAKTGYSWPVAENARGHLLICLTILESQINAIAASLLLVQPLIHYNDIPKTETAGMPYFNKLAEGKISTLPPFTSRQTIRTQSGAAPVTVHIYKIFKKVIVKVLKKTIKVWSRRDSKLKGDCRGSQRHIRLIKSPAAINGHNTNLESDITNWAVSDPGNIFCHIDKPYFKNQTREPAMARILKHQNVRIEMVLITAIVYKAPGQDNGKIILATAAGAWNDGAQALSSDNGHSFATALQHVVRDNGNIKFLAYNNAPPGVANVKTKSNSKGVIILATNADSAAWIVHTVPGFPAAKTGYTYAQSKAFFRAILYKAPAQNTGKALIVGGANWQVYPAITGLVDHSFGRAIEHVVSFNANNKFIAYSNVPPDLPKVKTKSNSKGVLMMDPGATDAAAWIVHTVPGFPKALRGYVFPPAEIQKGHLLICLTIKESQIDPIAKTLRIATPLIYHSDIPDTQMNSRPNLKKLVDGESRFVPPLTVSQEISTESAQGLKVTIYSKGEKSRYEMYKRILVKQLKSTIKVWTTRDNILKSDCRKVGRNIKLITSPISVNGDASTLENDVSQWLVSEAGNKFCAIDKPYHKSQAIEPAMAVCIDDTTIFTRFNEIAFKIKIPLYNFNKIKHFPSNNKELLLFLLRLCHRSLLRRGKISVRHNQTKRLFFE